MAVGGLELKVSVDLDIAACEMFDVAQNLEEMLELVPDWQKPEAAKIKTRIINKMADWLNGEYETKV